MSYESAAFLDVFRDASGGNVKTPQSEFLDVGDIPVVDQGQGLIAGFVSDRSRVCNATPPVIVFGDHTRAIKYIDFEFAMGADGTKVLVPKQESDVKYLYYALQALHIPSAGYSRHYKFLKDARIPLPPLAEQKRIAGILDAADALRAKRRESLAQLDTLLQSTFLDMFGDPGRNSMALPTKSLGELGEWRSGGTPSRRDPEYFGGDIPWFSSGELNTMFVSESVEGITERALSETSAKRVPPGALMLGMYDTAALKASLTEVECACNQAIAFSALNVDKCHPLYVYVAIVVGREHFRRLQRGVRQKNLNLSMVRAIRIPIPELAKQRTFGQITLAIEAQKNVEGAHLADLDTLFASLQSRAFRGDL